MTFKLKNDCETCIFKNDIRLVNGAELTASGGEIKVPHCFAEIYFEEEDESHCWNKQSQRNPKLFLSQDDAGFNNLDTLFGLGHLNVSDPGSSKLNFDSH